jgi:hypothetical protein
LLDHLHQVQQRRQQLFVQGQGGTDVDGGRDDVVAALAAVDVIVGLTGSPSRRLARVAITSLAFMLELVPEPVWKISTGKCCMKSPSSRPCAASTDGLALRGAELVEFDVGLGGGGFGQDQRADELRRHRLAADREVVDRALGLRAVESVHRHLQFAHAVALDTSLGHLKILAQFNERNRGCNSQVASCQV